MRLYYLQYSWTTTGAPEARAARHRRPVLVLRVPRASAAAAGRDQTADAPKARETLPYTASTLAAAPAKMCKTVSTVISTREAHYYCTVLIGAIADGPPAERSQFSNITLFAS